jgi:hypothetical protein
MRIYTADTALQTEDALFIPANGLAENAPEEQESSIDYFCAFVDFYTKQSDDPLHTSLVCEEQAEAVRITADDLSPETVQNLISTMVVAIDHLEKKWLDEQIQHEDRKRRHREDVARLHQQLCVLQPVSKTRVSLYQKGIDWVSRIIFRDKSPDRKVTRKRRPRKEAVAW